MAQTANVLFNVLTTQTVVPHLSTIDRLVLLFNQLITLHSLWYMVNHSYILLIINTLHIMKTALIASWKLVIAKGREMIIVTTVNNDTIWVPKSQFDTNAEQITFKSLKKGSDYTNSQGVVAHLAADREEYIGCGKQIVKKFNSMELIDHMIAKGVTPTFAMS